MRPIDDIAAEVDATLAERRTLEQGRARIRRSTKFLGEEADRTAVRLDGAIATQTGRAMQLEAELWSTWTEVGRLARGIADAALERRAHDALEVELLRLLGANELPTSEAHDVHQLTAEEHAYVTAALAAREATGQEERAVAFEGYVGARAALTCPAVTA